jgi:hypothetical protein
MADDFNNHQCSSSCNNQITYLFKTLVRDHSLGNMPQHVSVTDSVPLADNGLHVSVNDLVPVVNNDGVDVLDANNFPMEVNDNFKLKTIELWQEREKILLAGRFACAVCS